MRTNQIDMGPYRIHMQGGLYAESATSETTGGPVETSWVVVMNAKPVDPYEPVGPGKVLWRFVEWYPGKEHPCARQR